MATIQVSTTKIANRLLTYCEKRATEMSGIDCFADLEGAKEQFATTREIWGKTDGLQAHHVVQSFKPGEVSPDKANEVGRKFAESFAKGHEVVIYTHTDKKHIHNHIVINSVNCDTGKKFHRGGVDKLRELRELSDTVCKEYDLSIVLEPSAEKRYARADFGLAKRGIVSWKDEIRDVIDLEKNKAKDLAELQFNLSAKYNIDT